MPLARVCCLLLACCFAQGCAGFNQGYAEGQEQVALRQMSDLIDEGAASVRLGDSKFGEAWNRLDEDRAGARALAAESSESYGRAGEYVGKAAAVAEYASRLDIREWGRDYYRAKAEQYRNQVEQLRVRRRQTEVFSASASREEAAERLKPLKSEMENLTAAGGRLQEKVSRIEAEHDLVVPPIGGGK